MRLDAGDIALLPFPYADLTTTKRRPTLVLTPASYHQAHPDAVVAYMTSQPQRGPWTLRIDADDLASGRIPLDSWVRVDRLATVDRRLVRRVAGRVRPEALAHARGKLLRLLGARPHR